LISDSDAIADTIPNAVNTEDDAQLIKETQKMTLQGSETTLTDGVNENNQLVLHDQVEEVQGSELLPIPPDSDWTPWISLGLTTAAVAGGAYYFTGSLVAVSTMTVVRRVAFAYAVSHAEEARQRLQFLYPIWGESVKDAQARLDFLKDRNESGKCLFKCYYVQVLLIH
jgi:hypothetical protein